MRIHKIMPVVLILFCTLANSAPPIRTPQPVGPLFDAVILSGNPNQYTIQVTADRYFTSESIIAYANMDCTGPIVASHGVTSDTPTMFVHGHSYFSSNASMFNIVNTSGGALTWYSARSVQYIYYGGTSGVHTQKCSPTFPHGGWLNTIASSSGAPCSSANDCGYAYAISPDVW